MQAILFIAAIAVIVAYSYRQRDEITEEEPEPFDSLKLEREVSALHSDMQRLRQLDDMIIDLRLCKPAEAQRAFRMEWMSAAGQNHALDFMANGSNPSTEYLLELAAAEREEVNADVQRKIIDLYQRACVADYLTYRENGEKY